jgi:aspartyl-tRNA(Asn)/glutamyl-tRNA(Gln) amidotransferase subunit A
VARAFDSALAVLGSFATLVPDLELPDLPCDAAAELIIAAEAAAAFHDLLASGRVRELTAPEDHIGGYLGTVILATDYINALRLRGVAARALAQTLAKVDCYVAPTTDTVAPPIGKKLDEGWPKVEVPAGQKPGALSGGAANLVGLPGIAVPNGFGREGLPTSMCFTARAFGELAILDAAREFQARTDWHTRRPPATASP